MVNKKQKKMILISIIILVILLIFILILLSLTKKKENVSKIESNTTNVILDSRTEEQKDKDLIKKLKRMEEAERIRTYLGTYFKFIEKKDYESAYKLLYPEFKNNYFKNLEDFEKYIKEQKFPELMKISYDDISLVGKYYKVTVRVGSMLSETMTTAKKINLVIQENDYNNYYISFRK